MALCPVLAFSPLSHGSDLTSEDQILQAVDRFLEQQVKTYSKSLDSSQYTIQLKPPPGLNRLSLCSTTPSVSLVNSSKKPLGNVSTKVSCKQGSSWNTLIKAEISVYLPVVVSGVALERNEHIFSEQLLLRDRDIARLKQGYFTDIESVAGQKTKRSISQDKVITRRLLKAADLVSKGDKVTIIAGSAGFQVAMPGIALQKGQKYDQISVRNLKSGKVVVARVVEKGKVKTDY
ncbi:MAG: flagellar basal body P-ring formation chaperone FlgA [Endozoicomonas sp.]|uniref:flagellar basal body P-ring formation chaperone FlgA n=1 Tax=Endozoicomonas sp. TaxID=1892382 RepID=UPI003D9BDCC2